MRRWLPALFDLPGAVAFAGIVMWLVQTVRPRLAYPFDLEWMEGGMLVHALRASQGLPLYTEPTAEWIPFIYPPLYPWLVALVGGLTGGVDYPAGRLISLVGVAAACLALVAAVRREGGSGLLGLGAAALFLSCYEDSGTFYDLVRTDGLLIGLLAWSLVLVRRKAVVAGGLLLVLAFLAKHNAAAFGLPMLIWLWSAHGRALALRFAAASVLPALALLAVMQWQTGGLFLVYLLEVPSHHPFKLLRFFPGTPLELWSALPVGIVLMALGPLAAAILRRRRVSSTAAASAGSAPTETEGLGFWWAVIGLSLLLGMVMRGHHGGYLNVLVPTHWALSLGAALGVLQLRRALPGPTLRLVGIGITSLLLAGQVWQGRWQVAAQQPDQADLEGGQALVARIAAIDGEVLVPHAPWLPHQAGKAPSFPLIALWDIEHEGTLSPFAQRVDDAIADHKWAAIVTAKRNLGHGLADHYTLEQTLRFNGSAFMPKTGWPVRPRYIYVPLVAPDPGAPDQE